MLVTLVEAFENEYFPIGAPDPVAAILFRMDQMGMDRKALEPFLGGRSRVSEVLNRKRSLSMTQIRKLHEGLNIPFENLMGTDVTRLVLSHGSRPVGRSYTSNFRHQLRDIYRSNIICHRESLTPRIDNEFRFGIYVNASTVKSSAKLWRQTALDIDCPRLPPW